MVTSSGVEPYPIVDISGWVQEGIEDSGTNTPEWFRDPGSAQPWLFKESGNGSNNLHGKAWAEKIVYEVGTLLGIPCAPTHLATSSSRFGSISKNMASPETHLLSGSQLISEMFLDFDARDKKRRFHNLGVIQEILTGTQAPTGTKPQWLNGFDTFVGFLVLDALTASGDRHVENWGVLIGPEGRRLAPSWDHGNSLAFDLLESNREKWLGLGIDRFAAKGKPTKFEGGKGTTLAGLALDGLDRISANSREHWIEKVHSLTLEDLQGILMKVPQMSEGERTFAFELMVINRRRLLNDCST